MARKTDPQPAPLLPDTLLHAAQVALKQWPDADRESRLGSALLFSVLAETALLAAIGDAAGRMGGVIGAVWGARCNPEPAPPAFQMTDAQWHDDASIPSQGKSSGYRKVQVRVVQFGSIYILCPWLDVQLRVRLDLADIAIQIRTWTALAQDSVSSHLFPDLPSALRSLGVEHLSQAGFYAHERKHVSAVRGLLKTDRETGEVRKILDEAAAFVSTAAAQAQAKAQEIQRRLENRIDGDILAGFSHSSDPASSRPPEGMPTAPLPSEPMPAAGVSQQVWDDDQQALTAAGYTLV